MRSFWLFLALFGFWLLLSGQFDSPFLLGSGLVASAVTVLLCQRLDLIGPQYQPLQSLPRFFLYLPWLLVQIIRSSFEVTILAWSPRPDISPRLVEIPTPFDHPLAQTLLANSITLTPGTVTIDIDDESLRVHALGEKSARGVLDGSMEKRIGPMIPQRWERDDDEEEDKEEGKVSR
ncbi:MAG: Na+/H+ antiporter subunit E [Planctomycetota bacterium]|nr:Na+/H+ antiporter subunit E [Planctomycetota bacterium]